MHSFYQDGNTLWGCVLADAMTQIKNVGWTGGVGVGVRLAKCI